MSMHRVTLQNDYALLQQVAYKNTHFIFFLYVVIYCTHIIHLYAFNKTFKTYTLHMALCVFTIL